MTRNGPDDATRKGSPDAAAVRAMLAYATRRPRWGSRGVDRALEAVAHSRALVRRSPEEHTGLLVHALLVTARLLLDRSRATEALPMAQEAVALSRSLDGGSLVFSLHRLAEAYEALHRYSEAAESLAEADRVPPDA
ncbi:MAG: tetratricopeptide repeat protein [Nonomuraea sp.]|nr:tetratricopeptide repeat protein [Nonomuraea sp.]